MVNDERIHASTVISGVASNFRKILCGSLCSPSQITEIAYES